MNYSGRTAQLLTSKKSASYCNPQKSMYLDRKLGFAPAFHLGLEFTALS